MPEAEVGIKGVTPLMMHRYPTEEIKALEKKTPAEQAAIAAHKTEAGELFIPSVAIQRALVNGAVYSKGKGRASLQKVAAACLMITPDKAMLGTSEYEVDSRPVVMPSTKGRVMRHRPRLDEWEARFKVEWDEELLSEEQVRKVVEDTGKRVGLLEFSPRCKGPYGRFEISAWKSSK